MEILRDAIYSITEHINNIAKGLNEEDMESLIKAIITSEKVFLYGAGRSGLVAKAFAMRLMHLGITVYVVGESVTPSITDKDLLITISGSGETTSIVTSGKIAKSSGAKLAVITSYPTSSLGKMAEIVVLIKGRTKLIGEKDFFLRQIKGEHYPLAPLGTLFEVAVLVFLDALIVELMVRLGKTEDEMRYRHTQLE
ncbi:MAG TPA: 6-phospho-3-hexuloisomerase [Euryarchaeota archaeon]|nr:6-phospho-3-hexuloisomerase [Euryarchaeota archaeon]